MGQSPRSPMQGSQVGAPGLVPPPAGRALIVPAPPFTGWPCCRPAASRTGHSPSPASRAWTPGFQWQGPLQGCLSFPSVPCPTLREYLCPCPSARARQAAKPGGRALRGGALQGVWPGPPGRCKAQCGSCRGTGCCGCCPRGQRLAGAGIQGEARLTVLRQEVWQVLASPGPAVRESWGGVGPGARASAGHRVPVSKPWPGKAHGRGSWAGQSSWPEPRHSHGGPDHRRHNHGVWEVEGRPAIRARRTR